jgi:hypothetical protein
VSQKRNLTKVERELLNRLAITLRSVRHDHPKFKSNIEVSFGFFEGCYRWSAARSKWEYDHENYSD